MSIPTTETQPDSLHRAPRNQSQQVRKVLANAGPRQIHDFINDLIRRNQLNLNSIWQMFFSLALWRLVWFPICRSWCCLLL
jgi:hypothetical protein